MSSTSVSTPKAATITFWGAARIVTGSMHLIEAGNSRILLDCGLYQGSREESRARNAELPFPANKVDAVLISHAHIDHCGNLPTLTRNGFDGPIFCTPATRDLLTVMLMDSAKIQEEDALALNAQGRAEGKGGGTPYKPLYTRPDVERVFRQCVPVDYNTFQDVNKDIRFNFVEAGHVLGSAMVHLMAAGKKLDHTFTFTGDLGRRSLPLLRPSAPIPPAEVLICESTYGNRIHEPIENTVEKLYATIRKSVVESGTILIPAFSLGRTQLIIHYLQRGIESGRMPRVPIFVDSPLAANITEVHERHPECLTDEAQKSLKDGIGILGGDYVQYIREFEDSLRLNNMPGPKIIIASSGMCDAGRIVHHLRRNVDDPRCTVILVSYQAQGTTGRRLLENSPTIRIQGRDYQKWIKVVHLDGFSGHADRNDFMAYLEPLAGQVAHTRLIHGEKEPAEALAAMLLERGFTDVQIPTPGDKVELGD